MILKHILFFTLNHVDDISCKLIENLELMDIHAYWNPNTDELPPLTSDNTLTVCDNAEGILFSINRHLPYIEQWDETNTTSHTPKPVCYYDQIESLTCEYLINQWKRAHHLPLTIAQTERLYLKELSLTDYSNLYSIRQLEPMLSTLPALDSLEIELEKHKQYITYQYEFFDYGLWGVYLKNGTLIGQAGIQNHEYQEKNCLELSYMIAPEHQRKGYATEAILAIYEYAVSNLEINQMIAIIAKNNLPSIKTAMNLGMKRCEEVNYLGFACNYYAIDNIKDFLVYYHSEQKRVRAAKSAFRNAKKHPVQEVYRRYRS